MKKRTVVFFIVGLLVLTSQVMAQNIGWEIKKHSTDINVLKGEVTVMLNQGFAPLGLTYDENELYILYVEGIGLEIKSWLIEWYQTTDEIKKGMTGNTSRGMIPTGITYTGETFYVLYIEATGSTQAWLLVPSAVDLNSVKAEIQPEINKGYVPAGITLHGNEYWTLLLNTPTSTIKSWKIESYMVGQHGNAINRNIEQGYIPWGVEYRGERIDILYVGF